MTSKKSPNFIELEKTIARSTGKSELPELDVRKWPQVSKPTVKLRCKGKEDQVSKPKVKLRFKAKQHQMFKANDGKIISKKNKEWENIGKEFNSRHCYIKEV
jgi:hypothetical protein